MKINLIGLKKALDAQRAQIIETVLHAPPFNINAGTTEVEIPVGKLKAAFTQTGIEEREADKLILYLISLDGDETGVPKENSSKSRDRLQKIRSTERDRGWTP